MQTGSIENIRLPLGAGTSGGHGLTAGAVVAELVGGAMLLLALLAVLLLLLARRSTGGKRLAGGMRLWESIEWSILRQSRSL